MNPHVSTGLEWMFNPLQLESGGRKFSQGSLQLAKVHGRVESQCLLHYAAAAAVAATAASNGISCPRYLCESQRSLRHWQQQSTFSKNCEWEGHGDSERGANSFWFGTFYAHNSAWVVLDNFLMSLDIIRLFLFAIDHLVYFMSRYFPVFLKHQIKGYFECYMKVILHEDCHTLYFSELRDPVGF